MRFRFPGWIRTSVLCAGPVLALPVCGNIWAQTFPSRPITVVTTFQPIGGAGALVHLLAEALSARLGQPVLVDPRPAGLGAAAYAALSESPPDGHTIGFASSTLLIAAHLSEARADPLSKLAPITRLTSVPLLWAGNPSFPARSMADVIRIARQKPSTVRVGVAGSSIRIGLAQFEAATGTQLLHVPISATAQLETAILGGYIDIAVATPHTLLEHVKEGRLIGLGIGSLKRFFLTPQIPAISETVPGFAMGLWFAFLAPAGVPGERIDYLYREITAVSQIPAVREAMRELGFELLHETQGQSAAYLKNASAEYKRIIERYRITN